MLVLTEEVYHWAAVFSPYGNVHGGIVPAAGETDPDSVGGTTRGWWNDGMPRRHLTHSQAHPTQALTERLHVGVRLRGVEIGHTIILHGVMMMATLGTSLPGYSSPARMVVLTQRSPRLGELVVTVHWVSGREEDHVIAIAEGHGLQTPEPDHRSQRKSIFGVSHPEKWQESDVDTQHPLPGVPTIGVWTREGPKSTSEFVLHAPYSRW
jgi:hypothetical protein